MKYSKLVVGTLLAIYASGAALASGVMAFEWWSCRGRPDLACSYYGRSWLANAAIGAALALVAGTLAFLLIKYRNRPLRMSRRPRQV